MSRNSAANATSENRFKTPRHAILHVTHLLPCATGLAGAATVNLIVPEVT